MTTRPVRPAPPGALDPLITVLLEAGGRIDEGTRGRVLDRHQPTPALTSCLGCRFRYRASAKTCPSVIAVTVSIRAGLAAVPPDTITRPCRACHGPVPIPADTARQVKADGGPLCDSCTHQPSLFDDIPPAKARRQEATS